MIPIFNKYYCYLDNKKRSSEDSNKNNETMMISNYFFFSKFLKNKLEIEELEESLENETFLKNTCKFFN